MPFNVEGGFNAEGEVTPPDKEGGFVRSMVKSSIDSMKKPMTKEDLDD
jgi:hypothetical protein